LELPRGQNGRATKITARPRQPLNGMAGEEEGGGGSGPEHHAVGRGVGPGLDRRAATGGSNRLPAGTGGARQGDSR
jgi:hypothetical protein